jgi:hypothetical protein
MGRNDNLTPRERKALANENSGTKVKRQAIIGGRVAKAVMRRTSEASKRSGQEGKK